MFLTVSTSLRTGIAQPVNVPSAFSTLLTKKFTHVHVSLVDSDFFFFSSPSLFGAPDQRCGARNGPAQYSAYEWRLA